VVLTLVPNVLTELAPPLWRFCRKLVRKDCRAEVELEEPPVLPPRSPMSFSNAVLRVDSVLDDRLDEGSVLLISWLLAVCWTSAWSAEMMSWGPYDAAAAAPAALDAPAVAAVESAEEVTGAVDAAGVRAAVDAVGVDPDVVAAVVAGAEVAGAEEVAVDDDSLELPRAPPP